MINQKKAWEILERKYYAIQIKLASPLCVSNGLDEYSDSDVLRNGSGELFVPGTSIAGAFRSYLLLEKDKSGMMGFSKEQDGEMSSVYVSDLYLNAEQASSYFQMGDVCSKKFEMLVSDDLPFGAPVTSIRDAVSLKDNRRVENKFDMEIVETGAEGTLFLQYIKRNSREKEDFDGVFYKLLWAMHQGEIRFGSKKNRGFGRVEIKRVFEKSFIIEDAKKAELRKNWLAFSEKDVAFYEEKKDWFKKAAAHSENTYIKVQVPLKLKGGISVRKYSMEPNKADFEQLMCADKPVIPGSSWNGVIRACAKELLQELVSDKEAEHFMKCWFGEVDGKKSWQSDVVIAESIIYGGQDRIMTRNKISRFDSSTQSGALYTEKTHYFGTTVLEFMVKKKPGYEAMLGLLQLVVEEICRGQVAVGGQTAVGRGIFTSYDDKNDANMHSNGVVYRVEGFGAANWKDCKKALYNEIMDTNGEQVCSGTI